jgi:hypothetical protein
MGFLGRASGLGALSSMVGQNSNLLGQLELRHEPGSFHARRESTPALAAAASPE